MPPDRLAATPLVRHAGRWGSLGQPAMGWRIGRQDCSAAAAAAEETYGGVRMPADLLAGCSGTEWNPKDPVALVTDYRCCSEGMWRDLVEPHGNCLGLLITQRSRVQIPPPPLSSPGTSPLTSSREWGASPVLAAELAASLLGEPMEAVSEPWRMSRATVAAACSSRPGMTWL